MGDFRPCPQQHGREDVLCYNTPVLEKPVEVTGPIELVLSISSSALDTDFTGKLVDVYPDGRAIGAFIGNLLSSWAGCGGGMRPG